MANQFAINGANPGKQTKYTDLYNVRWSSGLWTNRSPLRDAVTTRLIEKYYGAAGDALIDGLNVEITNRLTLARRPGNPVYDNNSYTNVLYMAPFRLFTANTEQILVMIDQANALYSLSNGVKSLVFTKSTGAGQSFMQSVGNSLYFGNGVDNKKWLQSLVTWSAGATWNTPTTPFYTTFLIDSNGNIEQLIAATAASATITNVAFVSSTNTLTLTMSASVTLTAGNYIVWGLNTATWLNGITLSLNAASATTTVTGSLLNETRANYPSTADSLGKITLIGGSPVSGGTIPVWSTTVPSIANNFQGGITFDNTAVWVNRGNPVENWGLAAPTTAPTPAVGSSRVSWVKNTFYSLTSVIIDSNNNIQMVTTAGTTGGSAAAWSTTLGSTTTQGSAVFTLVQHGAGTAPDSLTWTAQVNYFIGQVDNITATSSTGTVITVTCNNNLSVGQFVFLQGTQETGLNGKLVQVATRSYTQFTANFTIAAYTNTNDGGTALGIGQFIKANVSGIFDLFYLRQTAFPQPFFNGTITCNGFAHSANGSFDLVFPTPAPDFTISAVQSLRWAPVTPLGIQVLILTMNGGGVTTGTTLAGLTNNWEVAITGTLHITTPGIYSFVFNHHDGAAIGFGNEVASSTASVKVSGTL